MERAVGRGLSAASDKKQNQGRPAAAAEQARACGLAPRAGGFVFSNDGGETPISGFSKFKAAFDEECAVEGWTVHDLRRTARCLMSRAGVPSHHGERCLGHVIGGVRGLYDVYEYKKEKATAYEALGDLIDRIVNPPAGNVTALRARTS